VKEKSKQRKILFLGYLYSMNGFTAILVIEEVSECVQNILAKFALLSAEPVA